MGSSNDDKQGIEALVRRMRQARGWSQQELANRAGVSFSFVNQVEGGKPTVRLDALNRLLAVFDYAMRAAPVGTAIPALTEAARDDLGEETASESARQKNDWACY